MIGYILIAIGGVLVAEDLFKKWRKSHGKLPKNGRDSDSGDNRGRKHSASEKTHGRRGLSKILPAKAEAAKEKKDVSEPIQQKKPNPPGSGAGNDSDGEQSATASGDDKGKGVKNGLEVDHENGVSDNGSNVSGESVSGNESDGKADLEGSET